MLALDQNDQVRVWHIRTIYQDEAITVDYGGAYWLNCGTLLSQQQRKIREYHTHILFPPEWPHTQDEQITAKKTGELVWAYAEASRNIYDTLIDTDESDDSGDDDNPDTTGTMEDSSDSTGKDDYPAPITEWTRSDEAPPGWRTKTLPLTPDATIKAVHEALEKVAQKIYPASSMNKLTVSRSRHILASIINKHARRRELLYDIIRQERLLDEDLEVAITYTDDDDNPIPIAFDLTLMLLAHHIKNTYSRTIHEWIKSHPIRIVDRRNPKAIEPPFGTECIRIRWTSSGVDVWSRRRLFDTVAPTLTNRSKPKRPLHRTQSNTISNYFKPIQAATPRKRMDPPICLVPISV